MLGSGQNEMNETKDTSAFGDERAASKIKVLIADDNAVNQRICAMFLRRGGFDSEVVQSGRETLEQVATGRFQIVLMDLRMPDMDGAEATRAIRSGEAGEACRDIPIIGLSAMIDSGSCDRFRQAGVDRLLRKPISMRGLDDAIREALSGRHGVEEIPTP